MKNFVAVEPIAFFHTWSKMDVALGQWHRIAKVLQESVAAAMADPTNVEQYRQISVHFGVGG